MIVSYLENWYFRWCRLLRWSKVSQVVVVIVQDSCAKDLIQFADAAPHLCAKFEMVILFCFRSRFLLEGY